MSDDEKPVAKFVRLQNGDDVITELVETEDDKGILYTFYHPLKLVYVPSETSGYVSIAFMPWVFPRVCNEQVFDIHAEDVMFVSDISEKMNIYYWDSVDSYLQVSNEIEQEKQEPELSVEEADELIDKLIGLRRTYH